MAQMCHGTNVGENSKTPFLDWTDFSWWVKPTHLTMTFRISSGQISSRPHTTDFPQKVAKEGKSPYFKEI